MKLRSLAVAALLIPSFAACGKKDGPPPAAANASAASNADLVKAGLAHSKKVAEAIISSKGDAAALKTALEALPKVDKEAIKKAILAGGAEVEKTHAADIAAFKKAFQEAAPLAKKLPEDLIAQYNVGAEVFLADLMQADGGEGGAEPQGEGGGEPQGEGGGEPQGEGGGEPQGAGGAEPQGAGGGEPQDQGEERISDEDLTMVNEYIEARLKAIDEHTDAPEDAATALQKLDEDAGGEAKPKFLAAFAKLTIDTKTLATWSADAGKSFKERIDALKSNDALLANETVAETLKTLQGGSTDDQANPGQ